MSLADRLEELAGKATRGKIYHNGGGTTFAKSGEYPAIRLARFDDFNDAELHEALIAALPTIIAALRKDQP